MGTIECMIKIKKSLYETLTEEDKKAIIEENKNIDVSYLSLIKEVLFYKSANLDTLLSGWGRGSTYKNRLIMADIGELRDRLETAIGPYEGLNIVSDKLFTHIFNFWSKGELEPFVEFVEGEENINNEEE